MTTHASQSTYQVTWRGIVHDTSGYARLARQCVLALDSAGVDVRIDPLNLGTPYAKLSHAESAAICRLMDRPISTTKRPIDVVNLQPQTFDPSTLRKPGGLVLCAPCWEATRVPAGWMTVANDYHGFIAFSSQNAHAFRESGITRPIHTVPVGVDLCDTTRVQPLVLDGFEHHFKFLSIFFWSHRKGPDLLLRAFWEEFGANECVSLVIKTGEGVPTMSAQRALREGIRRLRREWGFEGRSAPVLLCTDLLSDADLHGLYAASDAFVLPTRGEAIGLPFMEAMSFGLPVIATGWGGQTDFLTPETSLLVDYALQSTHATFPQAIAPTHPQLYSPDMQWAESNLGDLRQKMRLAFSDRVALASLATAGKAWASQQDVSKTAAALQRTFSALLDATA